MLLLFEAPAYACSCGYIQPSLEGMNRIEGRYERIFVGRVIAKRVAGTGDPGRLEFDLATSWSWKGEPSKTVSVRTSLHSASCGAGFIVGDEYLVFAHRTEAGELSTSLCSSLGIDYAHRHIDALNEFSEYKTRN